MLAPALQYAISLHEKTRFRPVSGLAVAGSFEYDETT
jgi:hypothetical protein